jgi:beta-glucosidase
VTRFPNGFVWGAATSAYQIEGSPLADGAGASIWHRFTHTPGRTLAGDTGDVACDFYRRYASDIDLMARLGLASFRFSVAWGRVLPTGRGRVNRKGLDFYARVVDRLLARGIQPMVTLYHWDLPAALDDLGGWRNPEVVDWFADYAEVMFKALGDRVPLWVTINEPWVIAHDGYITGCNAPGHRNLYEAPLVSHHLLMAHGAAVQRYRAIGKRQIGLAVNLEPKNPASRSAADRAATRRADVYINSHYLDPVFRGKYPKDLPALFGAAWPKFPASDFKLIREPIDFLGINYYTRKVVRNDATDWPTRASGVRQPRATYTDTGWEMHPQSLTRTLEWVAKRYGDIPLYITENGAALPEPPVAIGGRLDDPLRVRYYHEHLLAALTAIGDGVNLRGYYAWSLLDNLEWSSGFARRFGLVHVDFKSQRRTPKTSARYYTEVIRSNGEALAEAPAKVLARVAAPGRATVRGAARRARAATGSRRSRRS